MRGKERSSGFTRGILEADCEGSMLGEMLKRWTFGEGKEGWRVQVLTVEGNYG